MSLVSSTVTKSILLAAAFIITSPVAQAAPQGPSMAAAIKGAGNHLAVELVQLSPNAQRNQDNRRFGAAVGLGLAAGVLGAAVGSSASNPAYPIYHESHPVFDGNRGPRYYDEPPRPYYRDRPRVTYDRPEYRRPQRVYDDQYEQPYRRPQRVYVQQRGGGNADYCFSRYRSYNPSTGTYIAFDGSERYCQ